MADIALTSANIRALTVNGAVVRPETAGGTITIGHLVFMAPDGDVETADANVAGSEQAIGIAVESYDGETSVTAGNPVSVCWLGPVDGFSGMTPGDVLYLSNTAGRVADAAGAFSRIIGRARTATQIWVQPIPSDAAST